ncbi:MAG: hypothetical protein WCL18_02990 [bacterium]
MQKIISAQNGDPDVDSEKLVLGEQSKDIFAEKSGVVSAIDMHTLNILARTLGAPIDLTAGVYLHHKLGAKIKK